MMTNFPRGLLAVPEKLEGFENIKTVLCKTEYIKILVFDNDNLTYVKPNINFSSKYFLAYGDSICGGKYGFLETNRLFLYGTDKSFQTLEGTTPSKLECSEAEPSALGIDVKQFIINDGLFLWSDEADFPFERFLVRRCIKMNERDVENWLSNYENFETMYQIYDLFESAEFERNYGVKKRIHTLMPEVIRSNENAHKKINFR